MPCSVIHLDHRSTGMLALPWDIANRLCLPGFVLIPDELHRIVFGSCVTEEPDGKNNSLAQATVKHRGLLKTMHLTWQSNQCITSRSGVDLVEHYVRRRNRIFRFSRGTQFFRRASYQRF